MENFGMSMLWFWVAYFIVTLIGVLHTVFNIAVLHMKSMKDSPGMGEGYEKTKPWHPLYNIVVFSVFGYVYMAGLGRPTVTEALVTGAIWAGVTVVVDLFGWVVIKHPWSLTFKGVLCGLPALDHVDLCRHIFGAAHRVWVLHPGLLNTGRKEEGRRPVFSRAARLLFFHNPPDLGKNTILQFVYI